MTPDGFNQKYSQRGPQKSGGKRAGSGVTTTKVEYRTSARHDGNTEAKQHMNVLNSSWLTGSVQSIEGNDAEQK